MSEIKQETGYAAAKNVSAKPLNGAIPGASRVMDWSKGDLKSLFVEPAAKSPLLKQAGPAAAKPETEQPKLQEKEAAKPVALDNDNQDAGPRAQAPSNETELKAAAAKPQTQIVVPPQFAPVMAAGDLSTLQRETAQNLGDANAMVLNSTDAKDKAEFQLGTGGYAAMRLRHEMNMREELTERDSRSSAKENDALIEQYYAQQQREAFKQTMEYSAALETVNTEMRQQQQEMTVLRTRIKNLDTRIEEQKVEMAEINQDIKTTTTHRDGLEDLKGKRDQFEKDAATANAATAESDAANKVQNDAKNNATIVYEGNTYFKKTENGKETVHKVDKDGNVSEFTDPVLFNSKKEMIYTRKGADGKPEFIDETGAKVDDKIKTQIEASLKAMGKSADEVMPDYDAYQQNANSTEAKAAEAKATEAIERAADSEQKLWAAADKMRVPRSELSNLEDMIDAQNEKLVALGAKKEALTKDMTKTLEEREMAQKQLTKIEAQYSENQKFKERLEKGEFKDEKEMLDAMPERMRNDYQAAKAEKAAANKAEPVAADNKATATASAPSADNTSRTNGSAAEPTVTASTTLGPPFTAAANGTPATPAPAEPEAPAPELVANNQQKNNLAAARM